MSLATGVVTWRTHQHEAVVAALGVAPAKPPVNAPIQIPSITNYLASGQTYMYTASCEHTADIQGRHLTTHHQEVLVTTRTRQLA